MEWVSVKDTAREIPWTKVCIYDGGNTFWAQLNQMVITNGGRTLDWEIYGRPDNYPDLDPTHWMKITYPK